LLTINIRVKLPKTFLAVNLSDAFSFQEQQNCSDNEGLEMKGKDSAGEGRTAEGEAIPEQSADAGTDAASLAQEVVASSAAEEAVGDVTTDMPEGEQHVEGPNA
jgi:hypothetical protein